ncbi:MAG: CpsD/CapB family tyrosine-protein kinase [Pseudomonadota bacterium]|nr:CpsD/CapB family tyrosine-protein kinase [Pseudomonadota bacterium]
MSNDGYGDVIDARMGQLDRDLPQLGNRGMFGRKTLRAGAHLRIVSRNDAPMPLRPLVDAPGACDAWHGLAQVGLGQNSMFRADTPAGVDDAVEASFDMLRTKLVKMLRANGWNRVAVAAPTRGCGATFSAVSLAMSLAGIPGTRTVLMDMNLRRPGVADALDITAAGTMRAFLTGATGLSDHMVRAGDALALGLTRGAANDAGDVLNSDVCATVFNDMIDRLSPDVALCDLPPVLENDDLSAFLPHVDGVILVADADQTTADHIARCEAQLFGQTQILGVVLNQAARSGPAPYFA